MKTPNQILKELNSERKEFLNSVVKQIEDRLEKDFIGRPVIIYQSFKLKEIQAIENALKDKLRESKWGLKIEDVSSQKDGDGVKLTVTPQEYPEEVGGLSESSRHFYD